MTKSKWVSGVVCDGWWYRGTCGTGVLPHTLMTEIDPAAGHQPGTQVNEGLKKRRN